MKRILLVICAVIPLAGCASHEGGTTASQEGGTTEKQQEFSTQSEVDQGNPEPKASPSFRPSINPQDPRAAQYPTRPQPDQVPPQTPP